MDDTFVVSSFKTGKVLFSVDQQDLALFLMCCMGIVAFMLLLHYSTLSNRKWRR